MIRRWLSLRKRNPALFIGIGAQKAGTTWLAKYLAQHPEVAFSPLKELHFFDWLDKPEIRTQVSQRFRNELEQAQKDLAQNPAENPRRQRVAALRQRLAMEKDPAIYQKYLLDLASRETRAVGEFTPAYSTLSLAGFKRMKDTAPNAHLIYLLRDPVDRYWSQLRFAEKRRGSDAFLARDRVLTELNTAPFERRSNYCRALTQIETLFKPGRYCVLFYENLLNPATHEDELKQLTDFLGIRYQRGNIEERVNVSPSVRIPDGAPSKLAHHFEASYRAVEARFSARLPPRWREHMELLTA